MCVCLSVASHISETSEAIAITFDTVTATVVRMYHITCFYLERGNSTMQEYADKTAVSVSITLSLGPPKLLRHVDIYQLNCVGVSQEGPWSNGMFSGLTPATHVQSWQNLFSFFYNSAAATPTSSEMCNFLFCFKQVLFWGATKQTISIKLATTVGHFYVTLTLQTFIGLAQLVFVSLRLCLCLSLSPRRRCRLIY